MQIGQRKDDIATTDLTAATIYEAALRFEVSHYTAAKLLAAINQAEEELQSGDPLLTNPPEGRIIIE